LGQRDEISEYPLTRNCTIYEGHKVLPPYQNEELCDRLNGETRNANRMLAEKYIQKHHFMHGLENGWII
jgi:hypothetical protein